MKLIEALLDLIYPPKCVFCRCLLRTGERTICMRCQESVEITARSVKRGEHYVQCFVLYDYEGAVKDSLHHFKFFGMQSYATVYGRLLAELLRRKNVEFDVLTWVPISRKRYKQRGYDQSYLLAVATAATLGVACERTLQKCRDNPPQSKQTDAARRRGNVLGVYRPVNVERFYGKRILLIDDIITTGATLSECSKVLAMAGAAQIECAAVAATQLSGKK